MFCCSKHDWTWPDKDILSDWKLSRGFLKNIQLKNVETQT